MTLANAIIEGDLLLVEQYLNMGAQIDEFDEYGFTPLIESAITNNVDMARYLLGRSADVNKKDTVGGTPLHWAVENNNLDMVKLFLDAGADPNAHNLSAEPILIRPILREQKELKKLLIDAGAKTRFANDYIQIKLLAHRYDLTGEIDIANSRGEFAELSLEGFFLESSVHILRQSLQGFLANFAAQEHKQYFDIYRQILRAMHAAAELIKYQQYQVSVRDHQKEIDALLSSPLLILPVNYDGHAIAFIRLGDMLVRCDRRLEEGSVNGIAFFKMGNPGALNKQLMRFMIFEKKDKDFLDKQLGEQLKLQLVGRMMIEPQVTGNCSWTSIAACVPATFFLLTDEIAEYPHGLVDHNHVAIEQYHAWRDWDKTNALNYCIHNFKTATGARKHSFGAVLAAVFFQRFDHRQGNKLTLARQLYRLLQTPGQEYHLKNYLEHYFYRNKTPAGKNLKKLIEACEQYY